MNIWKNDVVTALRNLGHASKLTDIYPAVRAIREARGDSSPKSTDAIIRRTIEQFSSSTTSYTGKEDLFESVDGIGKGIWKLRPNAEAKIITTHGFIVQETYNRLQDIHDAFGGSQQSGIAPSKNSPFIFLFTGGSGHDFGYNDSWENGVFNYFGEGQIGDMTLTKGNKAIRDHVALGKDLLLFQTLGKGKPVKYLGEFVCESYKEVIAQDRNQKDRIAYVFQLRSAEDTSANLDASPRSKNTSLEELRNKAYLAASNAPQKTPQTRTAPVRERRIDVKLYALARANGICECCGASAPFKDINGQPFLEVHHIQKLSDNGLDTPENVAAITPNCHKRIHHGEGGSEIDKKLAEEIANKERTFKQPHKLYAN